MLQKRFIQGICSEEIDIEEEVKVMKIAVAEPVYKEAEFVVAAPTA